MTPARLKEQAYGCLQEWCTESLKVDVDQHTLFRCGKVFSGPQAIKPATLMVHSIGPCTVGGPVPQLHVLLARDICFALTAPFEVWRWKGTTAALDDFPFFLKKFCKTQLFIPPLPSIAVCRLLMSGLCNAVL